MFQVLASLCAVPVLIVAGVGGGMIFLATRGKGDQKKQQKSSNEIRRESDL